MKIFEQGNQEQSGGAGVYGCMRRRFHVTLALVTFACGFVVAGAAGALPYVLPAALAAFLLLRWTLGLGRGCRGAGALKVALLTLLFWLAPLTFLWVMAAARKGTPAESEPDSHLTSRLMREEQAAAAPEPAPAAEDFPPCSPGTSAPAWEQTNLIWAGFIDRKALSKPKPSYPAEANGRRGPDTVAVWVVVDATGRVVSARPLSGHPLLRPAAARAACSARFSPPLINGPPIWVSGVLTYRFER